MAAVERTNENTNAKVAEWLRSILDEVIEAVEAGDMTPRFGSIENEEMEFDHEGVRYAVQNGERRLVFEWYDPNFDNRRKVVRDALRGDAQAGDEPC